ncbi:DUF115 domain-containing protein [Alteromonas sp. 1_MG-2023]|uniref:motility associated factor glycosyltransferase family protein n=1 Tax=unclassified Alteromonas TaxID=2614992 RepID=UPI0026E3AEF5|nr:6-hydroxymethylpterin diphosphokinase MptE-like protein [Alteromonas sp. 1_MG-2023]MDO6476477.1 DUF115 domain-containing protein [Alteromonas sp. 1_MG-2023]
MIINDIRIHLHADEEIQKSIEAENAETLIKTYKKGLQTLKINMPQLASLVENERSSNISVFCNKFGELNIIDYGAGQAFYGLHPEQEVCSHVDSWASHAAKKYSLKSPPSPDKSSRLENAPLVKGDTIDTLVSLGLGGGIHIEYLLTEYSIRHLIIYEPEIQYFKASLMMCDWSRIFSVARDNNTLLFFMPQNNGNTIVDDLLELKQHENINDFYLYKHYSTPVSDAIFRAFSEDDWAVLSAQNLNVEKYIRRDVLKPVWSTVYLDPDTHEALNDTAPRFVENLKAFKKYFPDIFDEFKEFTPAYWFPVKCENGDINLLDKTDNTLFLSNPRTEGELNQQNFARYPHKDGLIMGYTGGKLNDYLHYQYVEETEGLLDKLHETKSNLPEEIKSLILFGLGFGYQLEALLASHSVNKLFICEPDRDFFYASLFAIDWQAIFDQTEAIEGRLYVNIGDDGSNLSNDLTHQFYAVGPYNLVDTYFYQSYFNPTLSHAIANMREHLQLLISMGEYFDHARFGISHTKEMILRGSPILTKKALRPVPADIADVPVFIVGNGPSLDASIEAIKEWRDSSIVISCGTALMPLEKAGITPDYHAEIEQNRSTFDWCSRVGAFDYLKKITLISCNGIHPDTSDLFGKTLIAFKDGESSTVSSLEVLGRENYTELKFAYPTVANLVNNLFCELGFTQLYLFGIDLGFADDTYHHSKDSGYYDEDGNEIYDYREANNTAIKTRGNFRPFVFTKYEFKMSRTILEQVYSKYQGSTCYNTSDGAFINGTSPLAPDLILTTSTPQAREASRTFIDTLAFRPVSNTAQFAETYNERYQTDSFRNEAEKLRSLIDSTEATATAVERLVDAQRKLIFDSYSNGKSLLFYLLHGTVNYTNAFLIKVIASDEAETLLPAALESWKKWSEILINDYLEAPDAYDLISSFRHLRIASYTKKYALVRNCRFWFPESNPWFEKAYTDFFNHGTNASNSAPTELILFSRVWNDDSIDKANQIILRTPCDMIFIGVCSFEQLQNWRSREDTPETGVSYYYYPSLHDNTSTQDAEILAGELPFFAPVYHARQMSLMRKNIARSCIFIQKLRFANVPSDTMLTEINNQLSLFDGFKCFIDFGNYLAIPLSADHYKTIGVDIKGDRGKIRNRSMRADDLYFELTEEAYSKQKRWLKSLDF